MSSTRDDLKHARVIFDTMLEVELFKAVVDQYVSERIEAIEQDFSEIMSNYEGSEVIDILHTFLAENYRLKMGLPEDTHIIQQVNVEAIEEAIDAFSALIGECIPGYKNNAGHPMSTLASARQLGYNKAIDIIKANLSKKGFKLP